MRLGAGRGAVRVACAAIPAAVVAFATQPASPAHAAPKRVALDGNATVASVDGPGRLTLTTKGGLLKVRLDLVDTPQPGECGADESTAALRQLTAGRAKRVRYVLWSRRTDAEGRRPALVGPRNADLIARSLARDLIKLEWARSGGTRTISEPDGITINAGAEPYGPRAARGIWARCGGHLHLPATEPAPTHAPQPWTITPDGITHAIGPITLSPTLAPGTLPTVGDIAATARVETTQLNARTCWARVPSMELLLWASVAVGTPCRDGQIYGISTYGPGTPTTSVGLRAGQPASAARALFPRIAATDPNQPTSSRFWLSGATYVPWAWQTRAAVNEDDPTSAILGFFTTTTRTENG